MLVKSYAAAVQGISATVVTIEVNCTKGIQFFLVGLPDVAVRESHERIISALQVSGYKFPRNRIVINMAPADIRKEGSSYDLPLAIGILAAAEELDASRLGHYMMMGELSLDGSLKSVKGILPIAIKAREEGFKGFIVPKQNAREAAVVNDLDVYGVSTIKEVIEFIAGRRDLEPTVVNTREEFYARQLQFEAVTSTQSSLAPRAEQLKKNAYRAVTPVLISLVVMIATVLMLFYFTMLYCVNPIVAMNKGLGQYLTFRIPFAVKAECKDEILELKEKIEALVAMLKQNKA